MEINGEEIEYFRNIISFYVAEDVLDVRKCLEAIKDDLSQKEKEEKTDFVAISSILHQIVWKCVDVELSESAERNLIVEHLVDEMLRNICEKIGFDQFDFHVEESKLCSELEMEKLILDEINDILMENDIKDDKLSILGENFELDEENEEIIRIEDVKSENSGLFEVYEGDKTKEAAGSGILEEKNEILMENVIGNENSPNSHNIFDEKMEKIATEERKLEDLRENGLIEVFAANETNEEPQTNIFDRTSEIPMENDVEDEKTSILDDNFDENKRDFEETMDKNQTEEIEFENEEKDEIIQVFASDEPKEEAETPISDELRDILTEKQENRTINEKNSIENDEKLTENDENPTENDENPTVNDENPTENEFAMKTDVENDENATENDENPSENDENRTENDENPTENDENATENEFAMEIDVENDENMAQIVPELEEINIPDVRYEQNEKKIRRENEWQVPKLEDDIEDVDEDFYPDDVKNKKLTNAVEKTLDSANFASRRRSVLRLGLSRTQKVKQLHNYLFRK